MEDIIDTGASKAFNRTFLDKLPLNHLTIRISESVDQIEDYRAFVSLNRIAVDVKLDDFNLFVL